MRWPRQFKWLLVLLLIPLIWGLWARFQPTTATPTLARGLDEAKAIPTPPVTVVVNDPPPPPIKPLQKRLPNYFRNPLPPDAPPPLVAKPTVVPPLAQGSVAPPKPVAVPAPAKAALLPTSVDQPTKAPTTAQPPPPSPIVRWAQQQQLRLVSTAIGDQRVATLSTLAGEATFAEGENLEGEIWLFKVYSDHVVLKQQASLLEVR